MNLVGQIAAASARHGLATTLTLGGFVTGLLAIGVFIRPAGVLSMSPNEKESGSTISGSLSDAKIEVLRELKHLLESVHALIDARTGPGGSSELVLWMEDRRDPGTVNEDEVLIVTAPPLLHAVIGLTAPALEEPSPRVPMRSLFSDSLSADWRRRSSVRQSVLATDVTAMRVESVRRVAGEVTLRVNLTFESGSADETATQGAAGVPGIGERHVDAMFVIRIRSGAGFTARDRASEADQNFGFAR